MSNKKGTNMGKSDYDGGIPEEAKNFKAPPDTKTETKPASTPSRGEGFLSSLRSSLDKRVKDKSLTQEEADSKLERAGLIDEATLPEDLNQAAELFASSGNASEAETAAILKSSTGEKKDDRDREPTEAELEFYRNMTHEEWEARVAKGKQETADIVAQREENTRQHQERQREKWSKKTEALEAIQPTGNTIEDAQAFFEAIQLDPNTLDTRYKTAYQKGDRKGMLEYFKDVEKSAGTLPASMNQYAQEYFRKFDEVVKKIISTTEAVGKRQ